MDMNISRAGRIRKKSSKLADFESSAEIDLIVTQPSSQKKKSKESSHAQQIQMGTSQQLKDAAFMVDEMPPDQLLADDNSDTDDFDVDFRDEDFERIPDIEDDEALDDENVDVDGDSEDSEEGNLMIDDTKGQRSRSVASSSVYLSENSATGRRIATTGGRRASRRDKGSHRITPYMLWAKNARKEIISQNPRMDFTSVSKKLSEIWSTLSASEKDLWKRRAKRLTVKGTSIKSQLPQMSKAPGHVAAPTSNIAPRQQYGIRSPTYSRTAVSTTSAVDIAMHKAVGTTTLDSAAHLKLLGESLAVIGERLTEHEGQIAVSGSLSVLLDSLLCAMGPLLCLTQHVPELNVVPQETLSRTLDNIAYIMPGL